MSEQGPGVTTYVDLSRALNRAITRGVILAAALALLISFFDTIAVIVLFFLVASVFAIALIPAVNWLEEHRVRRSFGAVLMLACVVGCFVGVALLVAPRLRSDINSIAEDLPTYSQQIQDRVSDFLESHPDFERRVSTTRIFQSAWPSGESLVRGIGRYSASIIGLAVGTLLLLALIGYMVAMPRPLLRGILQAFPSQHRDNVAAALAIGSGATVRWVWSNAVIGAIEAVIAATFLSWLGIPGAWLWALVTFFAELIPYLGSYVMALPPAIVAFAIDPIKAVWVVLFYIVMQQLFSDVVGPPIRARAMKIHPVSELFAVLALTAAFGLIGAIIAAPLIAFVKAFYDEFYGRLHNDDSLLDERVEQVLHRRLSPDR